MKTCRQCGVEFEGRSWVFCSKKCRDDFAYYKPRGTYVHQKTCATCKAQFVGAKLSKYCSLACRPKQVLNEAQKARQKQRQAKWRESHPKKYTIFDRVCMVCLRPFQTNQPRQKFCSGACSAKHHVRQYRERHRDRVAEARKRRYVPKRKPCRSCGVEIVGRKQYCSRTCWRKSPTGIREARRKVEHKKSMGSKSPEHRKRDSQRSSQYILTRMKNDPVFRLKMNLRAAMRKLLKGKARGKSSLIGCDHKTLRSWMERQFKKGMSWENYGKFWVADHRLPLASFDLTIPSERAIACHYTNLQPLTWKRNSDKSDTIEDPQMLLFIGAWH